MQIIASRTHAAPQTVMTKISGTYWRTYCVCVCVCVCADSDDDDEKDMVAQMRKMNRKLITLHQDNVEMRALDVRCTRSLIV